MRVRVLAFATAATALGSAQSDREVGDGSTVADLTRQLAAERADLAACLERVAIAVDGKLAGPETPLSAGCEVALLPPVSGG